MLGITKVFFICFYYVYILVLYTYIYYIFFIIKRFYNKLKKKTDNMPLYKYTLPACKRPLLS